MCLDSVFCGLLPKSFNQTKDLAKASQKLSSRMERQDKGVRKKDERVKMDIFSDHIGICYKIDHFLTIFLILHW